MSSADGNFSVDQYEYFDGCGLEFLEAIPLYPEYRAAEVIPTYLYPFLLLLGSLGNVACMLLLRQLSLNTWSTCLYVAVQSAVELVILYIRCGGPWLFSVAGVNPSVFIMNSSDAMCKTYLFLLNVLLQMWPWLTVALAVELMISTRFPLRTYRMCTVERARAIVLLITILLVCLNLNYFWTWGWLEEKGCIYIEEFSLEFLNIIWPSIEIVVKHVLPLIIVAACFLVSVVSLLQSGRKGALSNEPILKRYFLDLQALEQLKHAALVLVLLFLVVKTFTFVVEMLNALEKKGVIVVPCEDLAGFTARFTLVKAVLEISIHCFHSLKFFVFFACCAVFRNKFLAFVRGLFSCRWRRGGTYNTRKSELSKLKDSSAVVSVGMEAAEDNSVDNDNVHTRLAAAADAAAEPNNHRASFPKKTTHV